MIRHTVLCLVILSVLLAGLASGTSDTLKPYQPFDEPKPKLPNEILTDSRLDKHVKVFVKSKNLQQLFAELSAKTDVKILTSQKLWGERAIIYFHDRPLRDVMTEVSNLFGYHWSVEGFPGRYRYELYEDSKHAARREELRQEQLDAKNDLYLLYLKKYASDTLDPQAIKRLSDTNAPRYKALTHPINMERARLLMQLGEPILRKAIAEGSLSCRFADLPQQWQTAMCEKANREIEEALAYAREQGMEVPDWQPYTPANVASATVDVEWRRPAGYGMPGVGVGVDTGDENRWFPGLASPMVSEFVARDLAGLELASILEGVPLPEKPETTIKELRWLDFWRQGLLLGDVLQGIGEQSDVDVIADFHYQPKSERGAVRGIPIGKLVTSLCQDMDYSCRFDGNTIRLRLNKWYVEPLCVEPPASLIERCWKSLEDNGCISLDVQMEIASLPEKQMHWPGLGLIHGASFPASSKDSLLFLKALGPELRTIAQSEKGLPASSLLPDQYNQFVQWAATLKPDIPPSDLQQSVITLRFDKQINDEGGDNYKLFLNLPDGTSEHARISVMQLYPESMKGYPASHRKDQKADIIEVLD